MTDGSKPVAGKTPGKACLPGDTWAQAGTLLLLFFLAGLYLLRLNHAPPYINDELHYFSISKDLLAGHGYVDASFTGSPVHPVWPIFGPLLTAGMMTIFGENYFLLRAAHLLTGFAALIPIYFLFKKICGRGKALGIVLLTTASCGVFPGVAAIRADLPYFLFSFSFLLWAEKLRRGNNCSAADFMFAALFLALSCLSRQIGMALLLVLPASFLLGMPGNPGCRKKTGLFMFFSILAFGVYSLASRAGSNAGSNYLAYFQFTGAGAGHIYSSFLLGIAKNAYALLFYGFPTVLSGLVFESRNYYALSVSLLVLAGFITRVLREKTALDLYFFIYSIVMLLYPGTDQTAIRYVIPLAPAAFYYLLSALEVLSGPFIRKPAPILTAIILSAELAVTLVQSSSRGGENVARLAEGTKQMTGWVKENTPADALFLSNNPQALHIYAARKSVRSSFLLPTPVLKEPGTALVWIDGNHVDYIVTDGFWERTQQELYPAIGACRACFRIVYSKTGFSIYKVNKAALQKRVTAGRGKS